MFKNSATAQNLSQGDRCELFGALIDAVEDWLESKGIKPSDIPNEEREDGDESAAIIYGSDYDELANSFAAVLGIDRDNSTSLLGLTNQGCEEVEERKNRYGEANSILLAKKDALLNTLQFAYRNCDAGFDSENFEFLIKYIKNLDKSELTQEQEHER